MTSLPESKLTAEDFLAWAQDRPGKHELFDGAIVAQAAERAAHAERKLAIALALRDAVRKRGLPCHVLPDGMAVKIDERTVYEPDALVYCGEKLSPDALAVENPIIIVEIGSPSTSHRDNAEKLAGYFNLPSVVHYLIIHPDKHLVIHHQRVQGREISTNILREGELTLDPPGLAFELLQIYEA